MQPNIPSPFNSLPANRPRFGNGHLQDLLLAALAVAVISLMVLPLPVALLDGLISINIGLSVLLLMMAMYVRTPLALSTFPTLLLFTTLFRLSLNIASTRSILLHADAGKIIETFGKLVVGGNVVVGMVVFLIIAIVQFIVIAKGAERVAEVGARFTLDALPGKQMSIEAELRAGLIDKDESQIKRDLLQRESQLYGAMDGAMKFVKGDAIAGLLIALVNILAGISIGVAMSGMSLGEAINTFTILTVGDGLVSQIPSLFVSLAAGVLITRVSAHSNGTSPLHASGLAGSQPLNLASEIGGQITAQPKALLVTAFVLFLFIWVPGFPKLQFLFWAALFGVGGVLLNRIITKNAQRDPMAEDRLQRDGQLRARSSEDLRRSLVTTYSLKLYVSDSHQSDVERGHILHEITRARETITQRLGVPFPGVHLGIDATLPEQGYALLYNEVPVASGQGDCVQIGRVLSTSMRQYAADFLGLQETKELLNEAQRSFPDLVAEAQRVVPTPRLMQVLKLLIAEDIPIRNLRDILQALIEWSPKEKDPHALTEHARNALARQLTWQFGGRARTVYAITLSAEIEESVRAAIKQTPAGNYLALDAQRQQQLTEQALGLVQAARKPDDATVCVLASMDIRRFIKRMIEITAPELGVISYQDLSPDALVVGVGELTVQEARHPGGAS
jgi:type III secretion protein V